ncbi:uncharacterized protein LOC120535991 isoform X1 [Polypterus senegalus]|uniref:uncharacterized protein LOC120535991 isoform X1 n=1 Tax=Polypterus senegalus TaxID=55291 RepID=UPI0019656476|nr:uncharacterized protein LOC120535991 isoform X1 [Polypterus senegalus]
MADRHRRGVTPGRRDILLVALLGVLVARQVTVEGIKLFGTLGRSVVLPVSLTLHSEQQSIQWSFRKNDSKIRMVQHELHKQHMVSEPYRQRLSYMPNGSINLMNLRYSDDGVYEVLVTRIHGQVEMERISLHIIAPIPRTQIKVSTRVSQSSLSLFCQTEERTELSYWWLKDNKSLPRDGRHILSQENSSLEITNMTVGDCVSYTCVTANQLDHQETRHTLTAEDSPVCPMWSYNYLLSGSAGLLCLGGLCVIICYIRKHQEEALQFIRELCVGRHRWMPNGRGRDGGDFSVYEILELRPLDEPLRAQETIPSQLSQERLLSYVDVIQPPNRNAILPDAGGASASVTERLASQDVAHIYENRAVYAQEPNEPAANHELPAKGLTDAANHNTVRDNVVANQNPLNFHAWKKVSCQDLHHEYINDDLSSQPSSSELTARENPPSSPSAARDSSYQRTNDLYYNGH